MLFKSILLSFAAFSSVSAAVVGEVGFPPGFSNCGSETDDLTLTGVKMSNLAPRPGDEVVVEVYGFLKTALKSGATGKVSAKLGVLVVKTDEVNTCAKLVGYSCPVEPAKLNGEVFLQKVIYTVPKDVPKGVTVKLMVQAFNGDGNGQMDASKPVSCFTGPVKITGDAA